MHITEFDYVVDIRLVSLGIERIAQEYEQIDLILFDLRADLLHAAEMSRQMLVNIEVRHLFNKSSGGTGRVEFVAAQDPPVCNTEVLHQFLLGIMCD